MKTPTHHKALIIALTLATVPLVSGCYFQARGVVTPPRVAVDVRPPTPPTGRIVVRAEAPAPPAVTVSASARADGSSTAPAPAPSAPATPSTPELEYAAQPTYTTVSPAPASQTLAADQVVSITVPSPPPTPPSYAVSDIPPMRSGFTWIPGHYVRLDATWVWRPARWEVDRTGQVWVEPEYDEGRRVWTPGHFETRRIRDDRMRPEPRPQDLLPIPAPSAVSQLPAPPPAPRVDLDAEARVRVGASVRIR